jgi:hypothetical protein
MTARVLILLVLAALLEVGEDALIRSGLQPQRSSAVVVDFGIMKWVHPHIL